MSPLTPNSKMMQSNHQWTTIWPMQWFAYLIVCFYVGLNNLFGLRHFHPSQPQSLAVGDIVLILDNLKKRRKWKIARITKIFSGRYGGRVVLVRVGGPEFLQPIQKLAPFGVTSNRYCYPTLRNNQ